MSYRNLYYILGNHDQKTARKLFEVLDTAIKRKLITIFNKSSFFHLLTNGLQAKKTGDDQGFF